jgi:hypothetical protein
VSGVPAIDFTSLEPVGLEWGQVEVETGRTRIAAGAGTDAFIAPDGGVPIDRLVGLRLTLPDRPWRVSARVEPVFAAAFDAGALMLRMDTGAWAKLAFERSPAGDPMAVSVVTRDASDDANGAVYRREALYLRALFTGKAYAFHVSIDGARWDLLRFFGLAGQAVALDFIAQSPTGSGCVVTFAEAVMDDRIPGDLRDGT